MNYKPKVSYYYTVDKIVKSYDIRYTKHFEVFRIHKKKFGNVNEMLILFNKFNPQYQSLLTYNNCNCIKYMKTF